MFDLNQKKQIF